MKFVNGRKDINQWQLWYDRPAKSWDEALPLGNGRIGLMVYGDVYCEKINISEITCYSGQSSIDNCKKGSHKYIPQIRKPLYHRGEELQRRFMV